MTVGKSKLRGINYLKRGYKPYSRADIQILLKTLTWHQLQTLPYSKIVEMLWGMPDASTTFSIYVSPSE